MNRVRILCRYGDTLDFVASVLEGWELSSFWVGFWEEVRTNSDSSDSDVDGDTVGMFGEVITAYRKRSQRVIDLVVEEIVTDVRERGYDYSRIRNWSGGSDGVEITPEWIPVLESLTHFTTLLRQNLASSLVKPLFHQLGKELDVWIFEKVVLGGWFGSEGVRQLGRDLRSVERVVGYGLKKSGEAVGILIQGDDGEGGGEIPTQGWLTVDEVDAVMARRMG